MLRIGLPVNRVNVIKFFLLEVLISYVLEPAWELITSRSTHRRVVRGERVPLSSIAHSRTFPCAIASGRITTVIAVVLSLLVLGGSFASEYAVDAVRELIELPDTALVNTLQDGRRADPATINSSKETSIKISTVATFIADRCRYFDEETNSYRVNASFTNATTEEKACVNNNPNMPYQVSDLCILSKNAAHDFCCIWDGENSFDKSQSVPEVNWIAEVQHENHSVIAHTCDFRNVRETLLLACKNALILLACIAGNSLTIFDTVCAAVLVYRNLRKNVRAFKPISHIDLRVLDYFSTNFEMEPAYRTFGIPRNREGITLQLVLEGFGRDVDIRCVRDFRKDEVKIFTDINLTLLIPLIIASVALVIPSVIALILQPKKKMVFQPPISMEQLMSCARARDSGNKHLALGHPQQKLMLGFVRQDDGTQGFSVDVGDTEKEEGQ